MPNSKASTINSKSKNQTIGPAHAWKNTVEEQKQFFEKLEMKIDETLES